jgi:hypothetical protein
LKQEGADELSHILFGFVYWMSSEGYGPSSHGSRIVLIGYVAISQQSRSFKIVACERGSSKDNDALQEIDK